MLGSEVERAGGRLSAAVAAQVGLAAGLLRGWLFSGRRLPAVILATALAAAATGLVAARVDAGGPSDTAEPPPRSPSALRTTAGGAVPGPSTDPSADPSPPGAPPGAVAGLTGSSGNRTARLCWQPADGAAEYVLESRDVTAGEAWATMPYPIKERCYTVQQLLTGHAYEFRVLGSNSAGRGAPSNTVTVTAGPPLPGAVTGLTAVPGAATARLCWHSAAGADLYLFDHRDVTAGEAWATMPYPIKERCYTVQQLVAGHTYEFRIVGSNSAGKGAPSNTVTVSIDPGVSLPGPVTDLTAAPGQGTVKLCWQAARDAAEYVLEYRDTTAGEAWTTMPYPIKEQCYTVQQLAAGHTYEFRIVGSNRAGRGAPSNIVTATA
ncbi:fibronectin type III domain-containing protein [Pseudofrankia saprophytica]|uniref:fibronectin type III domain-containing protein n=1 Tax=Pseudofrankia saprophytica TaxID=298655 RepID=UPI000234CEAC|nr:fibronectin type III domain-containing protein [Pseudofrankia saprophytica]